MSREVALAMAHSAKKKFKSDVAVSVTGVAGPTKGDSDRDVGTVYIGVVTPEKDEVFEFQFGNHREKVTRKAVNKVMELLLAKLQED